MPIDFLRPNSDLIYSIPPGAIGPVDGWINTGANPATVITVEVSPLEGGSQFSGRIGWIEMGWSDGSAEGAVWKVGVGQPVIYGQTYLFEALEGAVVSGASPPGPPGSRKRLAVGFWPLTRAVGCRIRVREYW